MNPISSLSSCLLGTPGARRKLADALATRPNVISGVAQLQKLCATPPGHEADAPVFLFSAGWRSGSTLLQRLLMSDPGLLLWGEPYDECGIIQALAATVRGFRTSWPPTEYYYGGSRPGGGDWVANLFPGVDSLAAAHRAFFDTAFAEPARRAGASRWGIKEVRLSVEHAHYLRWLYPRASLVFLYRNPLRAYESYCGHGRDWYDTWPDKPVFTPAAFGRHWKMLAQGFLDGADRLGALVVRYEDLVAGAPGVVEAIERHAGVTVQRSILGDKVGSSERGGARATVSRLEKMLLRRYSAPLAAQLGYQW
jgi:hypothetical protein